MRSTSAARVHVDDVHERLETGDDVAWMRSGIMGMSGVLCVWSQVTGGSYLDLGPAYCCVSLRCAKVGNDLLPCEWRSQVTEVRTSLLYAVP